MANHIHPTAVIAPSVKLGDNISVGPYAVIDGEVSIGNGVEVGAHAVVTGWTTIGQGNRIFPHAAVGFDPQDKKYKRGDKTFLEIGENNIFREFCTVHRGSVDGGGITHIGSNNLFMAYAHVAHDVMVGNGCVLSNVATLAGHVVIEDSAIIGGLTGIHQFCRIGKNVMIGGCSRITQDVPPFALCNGSPGLIYGLNVVGLKRAGLKSSRLKVLKEAFRIMFYEGLAKSTAIERVEKEIELIPEVKHLLAFVKDSERGLCGSVKNGSETAE